MFDIRHHRLQRHFPALPKLKWRVMRLVGKRSDDVLQDAGERIQEAISEYRENHLADAREEFIQRHAARLLAHGGWELEYLDREHFDLDGRLEHVSMGTLIDLLQHWPSYADDPGFPVDELEDVDVLGELLANGYFIPPGDWEATEAEVYAILANSKIESAAFELREDVKYTKEGIPIYGGEFPWQTKRVVGASSLLVEAMEIVCYAERSLSEAQRHAMRTEMHAKMEAQIRAAARSEVGKAGADGRKKKYEAMEKAALKWYSQEKGDYKNKNDAAVALTKLFPVEFSTARDWLKGA